MPRTVHRDIAMTGDQDHRNVRGTTLAEIVPNAILKVYPGGRTACQPPCTTD